MAEEGGDNLVGGKMAKGCSYLAQVVWPGLSSLPLQFGLMGFAISVCSCWAGRDQPGAELDPKKAEDLPVEPSPAHNQFCAVSKAAAQLFLSLCEAIYSCSQSSCKGHFWFLFAWNLVPQRCLWKQAPGLTPAATP